MNSTALRYFAEVARSGSIAAAVERLHVAGSAVSRQIAALEYEVGTPLFDRQPRGMVLTDAGRNLAAHVRRSTLEEERILTEIRNKGTSSAGTIRMATSQGLASNLLPEIARKYRHTYNDIRFEVRALSPSEIVQSITEGEVDIGLAYGSGQHSGISVTHRQRVEACVVLAVDHPLASRASIELGELEQYPVVTSGDTTVREIINLRAALAGIHLDVVFQCDYSDALFEYCCSGEAITFASRTSVTNWLRRGELAAIPLSDPDLFQRNIEVQKMERRTLPLHVETFVEFLCAELSNLQD